ncbi:MAG: hypothetical protein J6C58_08640 [Bacteroidaceae bacterium]|nr:hypothetical protein [Bacteroidaceae bacterium]
MAINFKKLKSQIKPFKPEAKHTGYIFLATDEQKKHDVDSIAKAGSKRSFIQMMVWFIQDDEAYRKEFTL